MDYNFEGKNITCCSVELYWENNDKEKDEDDSLEYEVLQREKGNNYVEIYYGKGKYYEAINLNPNRIYIFKLNVKKDGERIFKKKIDVLTLNSPKAILSINSFKNANKEKIEYNYTLSESEKNIITNCYKLIFAENNDDIIIGNFSGIEIKITYTIENNINLCYISFDIKQPNHFENLFNEFIKESENNLLTPFYFVLEKLPTILIFNLLDKGPVILTGKRMGGVIASSLAFYILYQGKIMNINYGNSFIKKEKNCLGVVAFGTPSFLTNLTAGFKMKEFTSYFYNIRHEFDYIPVIIDYINKNNNYKELLNIFQKNELLNDDIKKLNYYLSENNFTDYATKTNKIPFGFYFMMKNSFNSLIYQNDFTFDNFYYLKDLHQNKIIYFLKLYQNISLNTKFNKEFLHFLANKNSKLELIKIIRRNYRNKNNTLDSSKGIIKFKLNEIEHNNNITPDIISRIKLICKNTHYNVSNKDIYYDTDYITAYIDNLNENIDKVIISNYFGGEIEVKNIINFQGSGSTRDMLLNNIGKLFLFPFFKLIEIFYISLNDTETYDKLKKENFGDNFDDLKILEPFKRQIKAINELLFLSRPDVLAQYEKEFIREYIGKELSDAQKKYFNEILKTYYEVALKIQLSQNINCLQSDKDSIAYETSFPHKFKEKKEIKKLFMCEMSSSNKDLFDSDKINDSYVKTFYIEKLIKIALNSIESLIKVELINKVDNECKNFLDNVVGKLYDEKVVVYIYFVLIIILSSFESGDEIQFNHDIDTEKISFMILYPFIWLKPKGDNRSNFEKDFKKVYSKNEIEEINIRNLYYRTKIRNFINSNISSSGKNITSKKKEKIKIFEVKINEQHTNKINDFSKYSEKRRYGKNYYKTFLKLLNYNSNDFQEDIEISIYDNLKKENKNAIENFNVIKEIMNNLIDDEESKKGFLALVRQSYLLGKLRINIVSIYIIFNFIL